MDISTGQAEQHQALLDLNAAGLPGVQQPTAVQPGQLAGPTYDARDTTGEYLAQMNSAEADARAAQAAGMSAESDRRSHYQGQIGDGMVIPPVPDNAVPPASSFLFPYSGDEPTPAMDFYNTGDEPK